MHLQQKSLLYEQAKRLNKPLPPGLLLLFFFNGVSAHILSILLKVELSIFILCLYSKRREKAYTKRYNDTKITPLRQ